MSNKQVKNKPVKKASTPSKKGIPAKKGTPVKAVNSNKPKKGSKPVKKTAVKKAASKVVSKKTTIKKAAKPAPKAIKKAVKPLKTKPVKKAVAKKAAPKPALAKKKTAPAKPVAKKQAAKKIAPKKASTPAKPVKEKAARAIDKELLKKVATPAVVASIVPKTKKDAKPAKKAEKPVKAESPKPAKGEKPRRSKKAKKSKDDEDEPAIENDPLIEEIIRSTKKKQSQPKKPKIIQTFVNPMASLAVATDIKKTSIPKKEPKGKFELEYVVRTSAGILYEFLTSPSGLSEWFADDVNIRDGIFTFYWDGSEQKARLLNFKDEKYVRMQWIDKPEGTYFEFRIEKDELTGDTSLLIIDFADEGSDLETSKRLWDSQVNKLLHVIGSY